MKNLSNKKKIILGSIIGVLIGTVLSVSYAFFTYSRIGTSNSQLVVGDIYMKYKETNQLTFENAMPSASYTTGKYFQFEVTGKNTYTEKGIIYDIVLNQGDASSDATRTIRLRDELLRFRLVRVVENETTHEEEEQEIFNNKSYLSLNNMRIHKETIPAETNSPITHTYRLYAWISDATIIGTGSGADYSIANWNKVFASVKVNVTGDFTDKEVRGSVYDLVKTGAIDDSDIDGNGTPIHFYEVNGDNNGNGKFVRSTTANDTYPIYYYRGNVDNNNVIFANKCWKIVRTTETGGTKMIYNGEQSLVYSKEFTDPDTYVNENDGDILTFDNTDNTWNYEVSDGSNREISFKVPAGDNYSIVATGTTGSTCGGGLEVYKDGVRVQSTSNGGGNPINYSYSYGTLSSSNVLKIIVNGSGSSTCGITLKMYMQQGSTKLQKNDYSVLMQKDSGTLGCDNTGNSSQLPSQAWNLSYESPAYVGYNYGTTAYEYSIGEWSIIWK